jgi:diguanylate cyclase (GGDEF)-like protein
MACVGVTYTLLTVRELWLGRGDGLLSRWPIIILLTLHATSLPLRIPLVTSLTASGFAQPRLLTVVLLESILLSMAGAYLFAALAKERFATMHEKAASLDPLTGVANRRSFLLRGERLVHRAVREQRPIALLLFDLDHFKAINDAFGHAAGDAVLVDFCRLATAQLRPTDIFARIGGEEFASLLPGTTAADAWRVAERIRKISGARMYNFERQSFRVTVSAGLAGSAGERSDLPSLLVSADRALYRAKHEGRDRVASEHPLVGSEPARTSSVA